MNIGLFIRTLRHLKLKQILFQCKNRLFTPKFTSVDIEDYNKLTIKEVINKNESFNNNKFTFINLSGKFESWNDTTHGMLWAYNLNYMDWILQPNLSFDISEKWIDKFVDEISSNKVGLDPYPIALRGINWIKFISLTFDKIKPEKLKKWNNSLYSQYILLSKKLEYHLLGNHLLEDVYSLFIASLYFHNESFYQKASNLLYKELDEQILPDGAHYEQSPMYHCILLDRLLDCYNFSFNNSLFKNQNLLNDFFRKKASQMLGHLNNVVYSDGEIPLLNDSAFTIAPTANQLFDYANRLQIDWQPLPMRECGYRKLKSARLEAIVDVGNITASYQAGHSHADTFNYELRIDGKPFIVDTGISTYNKTQRRQFERSTPAHNTVSIKNRNSSEIWGGFRVANRAKVSILEDTPNKIIATHNGFGKNYKHKRTFVVSENTFEIFDEITSQESAVSYIHFDNPISIISTCKDKIIIDKVIIYINGALFVEMIDEMKSEEFNKFTPIKTAKILFKDKLSYKISVR